MEQRHRLLRQLLGWLPLLALLLALPSRAAAQGQITTRYLEPNDEGGYNLAFRQEQGFRDANTYKGVLILHYGRFGEYPSSFHVWDIRGLTFAGNTAAVVVDLTYLKELRAIKPGAFQGCTGLRSTTLLPGTLQEIGDEAFDGCISLSDAIVIPSGVATLGARAYRNCKLIPSVVLDAAGTTTIGESAFQGCEKLSSITFLNWDQSTAQTSTIYAYAFAGCSSLLRFDMPISVGSIGNGLFDGCAALREVTLAPYIQGIQPYMFRGCTSLNGIDIPNYVKFIGDEAFKDCRNIVEVDIPNNVRYIQPKAFYGCDNLQRITLNPGIPGNNQTPGLENIEESAFAGCRNLRCVKLPQGIKKLGDGAFRNCNSLKSVLSTDCENFPTLGKDVFDEQTTFFVTDCTGHDNLSECPNVKNIIEAKYEVGVGDVQPEWVCNIPDGLWDDEPFTISIDGQLANTDKMTDEEQQCTFQVHLAAASRWTTTCRFTTPWASCAPPPTWSGSPTSAS